mmetsp:Transcript_8350/g.28642  ORF Transcript_8350/g.28642 Transcript_8350/m.28642 type:complete len:414 (-) Transcript_8350:139-1380(-)
MHKKKIISRGCHTLAVLLDQVQRRVVSGVDGVPALGLVWRISREDVSGLPKPAGRPHRVHALPGVPPVRPKVGAHHSRIWVPAQQAAPRQHIVEEVVSPGDPGRRQVPVCIRVAVPRQAELLEDHGLADLAGPAGVVLKIVQSLLLGLGVSGHRLVGVVPVPVFRPDVDGRVVDGFRLVQPLKVDAVVLGVDGVPFKADGNEVVGIHGLDERGRVLHPPQKVVEEVHSPGLVRELPAHDGRVLRVPHAVHGVGPPHDEPDVVVVELHRPLVPKSVGGEVHELVPRVATRWVVRNLLGVASPHQVLGQAPAPSPLVGEAHNRLHSPRAHLVQQEVQALQDFGVVHPWRGLHRWYDPVRLVVWALRPGHHPQVLHAPRGQLVELTPQPVSVAPWPAGAQVGAVPVVHPNEAVRAL